VTPRKSFRNPVSGFRFRWDSLRTKMKALKKATGAQYSRQSPEFASVKGIGL
jgi:hypothetical protein